MTNWKYTLHRSAWSALDLLFPPVCGGCDKTGSRWCEECQKKVKVLNGIVCDVCGLPQEQVGVCKTCLSDRPHFRMLRAWTVFENPIQHALHKLKYRKDMSMGDAIAFQMLPFVKNLNWQIDMIIPTPLGKQRMKERGYNQVAMVAKPLALALQVQYAPDAITRRKETRTQVGLTKPERKKNVEGAFQSSANVKRKHIVVMDDVSTTGATLSSIAEALYSAGAENVYALTVARALQHHSLQIV
ncbi:MAG: ComF family protein [Anaerolineales bacterium]|nr:ComF family protein [Anaerolineales bacterium]